MNIGWELNFIIRLFLGDRPVVACCILLNKYQVNGDSVVSKHLFIITSELSPFYSLCSVGNK